MNNKRRPGSIYQRFTYFKLKNILLNAETYYIFIRTIDNLTKEKCDQFEGLINDLIDETNGIIEEMEIKQAAYILYGKSKDLGFLLQTAEDLKIELDNYIRKVEQLYYNTHGSNSFGNINLNQILKDIKFLKK